MMEEVIELDIKQLLKGIWKRAWLVVLCAVLTAVISFVYTMNFITPTYKASVTMYVNNNSNISNSVSSSDLAVALQLANTYVNIIQSDSVLEKVIEETGLNLTSEQICQMLSAEVVDETEMFQVSIISPNPRMSKDIVNAIASIAPSEISRIIEGSSAKVIDYAKEPTSQYAPNYAVNTILGGAIGAAVVIIVIVLFIITDGRIRSESDLMRIGQFPVLGAIPDFTETTKRIEKKTENKERRKA